MTVRRTPFRPVLAASSGCCRIFDGSDRLPSRVHRIRAFAGFVLFLLPALRVAVGNEPTRISFADVTAHCKLQFLHHSPLTEQRHLHLTMGSGIGWIDFDRDGWSDLYCAQGKTYVPDNVPRQAHAGSASTGAVGVEQSDAILRNIRGEVFANVSSQAKIRTDDYAMGLAPGDYDNDGFPDLYVTVLGKNRLHRNNGDGTFTEVASEVGVADGGYGASSTWVDLNQDGTCELFVVNYLYIDHQNYPLCSTQYQNQVIPIVCPPRQLQAQHDVLYSSLSDGRFEDISQSSGLHSASAGHGLGVIAADFDGDGDVDVYVANDSVPNHLWMNQGDLKLQEEGDLSGTSLNRYGAREAGMGVVAGDISGNGRPDLFVTNYFNETNTLYRNEGHGLFLDVTSELGLAGVSRLKLGFGVSLLDADSDGWLDLFVTNGHVNDLLTQTGRDEPFAQQSQLLMNRQGIRFEDISESAGTWFQDSLVGRSSAVSDFNHDGRSDLAILQLNGPIVLLENQSTTNASSQAFTVQLIGTKCNRDAIGAVVTVEANVGTWVRHQVGSSGYLSADERPITIAVPEHSSVSRIRVDWPGGDSEIWPANSTRVVQTLVQGRGISVTRQQQ